MPGLAKHDDVREYYGRVLQGTGDRAIHYGPFDCGPLPARAAADGGIGGACC